MFEFNKKDSKIQDKLQYQACNQNLIADVKINNKSYKWNENTIKQFKQN